MLYFVYNAYSCIGEDEGEREKEGTPNNKKGMPARCAADQIILLNPRSAAQRFDILVGTRPWAIISPKYIPKIKIKEIGK